MGHAEPPRLRFRAMGTSVRVVVSPDVSPPGFRRASQTVEEIFDREEQRFSRFRSDSELSQVNAAGGRWVRISEPFVELLDLSIRAAERTGGLFDPTILPSLKAAGYNGDFRELREELAVPPAVPRPCGRWQEISRSEDLVRLPEGIAIDFGGIAKGWTVDLAAPAALDASGASWIVVNAGGDLRVDGAVPPGGIEVGVESPEAPHDEAMRFHLEAGAIATSSIVRRSWGPGLHHLIDPRTSLPATTGVLQATAWAPRCAEAEVLSKEALLLGPAVLRRVPGILVLDGDEIVTNLSHRDDGSSVDRANARDRARRVEVIA